MTETQEVRKRLAMAKVALFDGEEVDWIAASAAIDDALATIESQASRIAELERERDEDNCPVCAERIKPEDWCLTDIELGICHAACLEGSPMVDLETGEPLPDGAKPPKPYRYNEALEAAEAQRDRARSEAQELADTFVPWLRDWCHRRFGKWITYNTAVGARSDLQYRALRRIKGDGT